MKQGSGIPVRPMFEGCKRAGNLGKLMVTCMGAPPLISIIHVKNSVHPIKVHEFSHRS